MAGIALRPIGSIEPWVIEGLSQGLAETFGPAVEIKGELALPDHAYNPSRRQYLSTSILDMIKGLDPDDGKTLGVVDVDLYAPGLSFAFGIADLASGVAIISLHRLRQGLYGLPRDDALFAERALKEAVHELGHTCGLRHCRDANCVMYFSNSLSDTDRKGAVFCEGCLKRLEELKGVGTDGGGPAK